MATREASQLVESVVLALVQVPAGQQPEAIKLVVEQIDAFSPECANEHAALRKGRP
jgi:hypothetical protein